MLVQERAMQGDELYDVGVVGLRVGTVDLDTFVFHHDDAGPSGDALFKPEEDPASCCVSQGRSVSGHQWTLRRLNVARPAWPYCSHLPPHPTASKTVRS